jgi:hypothetical protein
MLGNPPPYSMANGNLPDVAESPGTGADTLDHMDMDAVMEELDTTTVPAGDESLEIDAS